MTVIIRDEFTGMSDGEDIGGRTPSPTNTPADTWSESAANDIEGDGAGQIKASANNDAAWIDAGEVDCSAAIEFNAGGGDNRAAVLARLNDANPTGASSDGYGLNWRTGIDTLVLFYRLDGTTTVLGANITFAMDESTTYKFEVEVSETTIKALVDDDEKASRTDSTIDGVTEGGTNVGFYHALRSTANGRFDNFEADDLVSAILASANVDGAGQLAASGDVLREASGNLLGSGDLSGNAEVIEAIEASGSLVGAGVLSGAADVLREGRGQFLGAGQIAAAGGVFVDGSGQLIGSGRLIVIIFSGPKIYLRGQYQPEIYLKGSVEGG
jgi:hypothetical protein